jgi:hypothetical protein
MQHTDCRYGWLRSSSGRPAPAEAPTVPARLDGELRAEGLGRAEDRPGRDVDAALGEELGDLPGGEGVAEIPAAVRMMSAGQR